MDYRGIKELAGCSIVCLVLLVLMFISFCTSPVDPVSGGGTRGGNPVLVGTIVDQSGNAAQNVRVSLIAADYNPVTDGPVDASLTVATDSSGEYSFNDISLGNYTIEAVSICDGSRLVKFNIAIIHDNTCTLSVDTLHAPGVLKVLLPENVDAANGYLYVPGTSIAASFDTSFDTLTIDSVPAGTIPILYYAEKSNELQKTIRYDILVQPDKITKINYPDWSYCQPIVLNTSPTGADVIEDVYEFPVLVRLGDDNFSFDEALEDGRDLMFTGVKGKKLPFEIEMWDVASQNAAIWVKVDTMYGNDSTQTILMYWGNPDASNLSNSAKVFDTVAGFAGVWHLGENGNDSAYDATYNSFNGTAYNMKESASVSGAIGKARLFDGSSGYISMANTADGKLNFPENGYFTISAWVYADTFDNVYRTIVSKGFEQYYLQLTYFPGDMPQWEFSTFSEADNWHMSNYPAEEKQWMLLTGIKEGDSQYLYCNGELVASTSAIYPQGVERDTKNDLSIGRFLKEATYPAEFGYCYFKGNIDEVRISSVARNAAWIRLCYMNQRSDDRLIRFK